MKKRKISDVLKSNKKIIIKAAIALIVIVLLIIFCNYDLPLPSNLISMVRIGSAVILFYFLISFRKEE